MRINKTEWEKIGSVSTRTRVFHDIYSSLYAAAAANAT